MLIVISPAKRLDEKSKIFEEHTNARNVGKTRELVNILKQYSPADLQKLMKINPKLADLNFGRYQMFRQRHTVQNSLQALFAFSGDVFLGMNAKNFEDVDVKYAQDHLRILSGLYGVLKPLDLIQPYRLEMGTKLRNEKGKDLYSFWGDKITSLIKADMRSSNTEVLFNLASGEYFKSIDTKKIKKRIVTADFREYKEGKYKFYPVFGKKARGMMTRYVLKNQISDIEELKGFQEENYYFEEKLSSENELIFVR